MKRHDYRQRRDRLAVTVGDVRIAQEKEVPNWT